MNPIQAPSTQQNQIPELLYDMDNNWGQDVTLAPVGDIGVVSGSDRTTQRILRRLMTNPGDYIWHPTYGAGLPRYVGRALSPEVLNRIKSVITSQIFLEDSVAKTPPPNIFLQPIQTGLFCQIEYVESPTQNPVVLQFNVSTIGQVTNAVTTVQL